MVCALYVNIKIHRLAGNTDGEKNNIEKNVQGNLIMERMGKCPDQVKCFLNGAGNNISV